jgi:D-glycero-D-manno-heptose 1,7-bisphosphate phosphatase
MSDGSRPAVFFDRDGTLIHDIGYPHRPEDLRWIPGAPDALRRCNAAHLVVVVISNQSGVARGYFSEADVERFHEHMGHELARSGAAIDAFYWCPHHVDGVVEAYRTACEDRKPGTGLFRRALADLDLDPARSFAVGDKNSDIEPGLALGMRTVLVRTGYGREAEPATPAHAVVDDVGAAVDWILSR